MMDHSWKVGVAFGMTSGIITTLGLVVGLHAGTHSRIVVVGGIVTIAVADACSDALGIHIAEEAEGVHTSSEIWAATLSTFFTKFLCAMSFLLPFLLMPISIAIWVCLCAGLGLLALWSHVVARSQGVRSAPAVAEHMLIAVLVIVMTHLLGNWISTWSS